MPAQERPRGFERFARATPPPSPSAGTPSRSGSATELTISSSAPTGSTASSPAPPARNPQAPFGRRIPRPLAASASYLRAPDSACRLHPLPGARMSLHELTVGVQAGLQRLHSERVDALPAARAACMSGSCAAHCPSSAGWDQRPAVAPLHPPRSGDEPNDEFQACRTTASLELGRGIQ